jgi:hypothetical protein
VQAGVQYDGTWINPQGESRLKRKRFSGCKMRPGLFQFISMSRTYLLNSGLCFPPYFQEQVMTPSQRLKYSILISLVVLGIMFGLSYMQNAGMITEKMFQYIAIGVAVVVVVINGVMRRKTKL